MEESYFKSERTQRRFWAKVERGGPQESQQVFFRRGSGGRWGCVSMRKTAAIPLLTLSLAVDAIAALDELHRVCLAMDAEQDGRRPTEEEYQAAVVRAGSVLRQWSPRRRKHAHTV
jgi:hypothetical protein